jgi:hypothetical protein
MVFDNVITRNKSDYSMFRILQTLIVIYSTKKQKPIISDDILESMINLYRSSRIFASEKPVRNTTKTLTYLLPNMVYPMHGSCIDKSLFSRYTSHNEK